ncbi:DUF4383 domain-containing protein [Actinoplanes friuliensis]|jgi:hypothetical protein|uniref:DUF4383 domain-containing protein n=1 Tax=Actinoplanes friuliensis DSM 7358 TaxID=1246995 RepID=U5W9H3_9ACTN|nr:DUF4383 domain-containing protein [Actinoplanes friuliensis]AGZ45799.1 hypothetical protein AFR_37725 [Actinoplanes friuliensis DSM 7358]
MVTDTRRRVVERTRDLTGPAALGLGVALVIVGLAGCLAVGRGSLLGLLQVTLPHNMFHLAVGTALVSAAILGPRPARVTATTAGLTFLGLGVAGLAGAPGVTPNGADIAFYLAFGLALTAVGRR